MDAASQIPLTPVEVLTPGIGVQTQTLQNITITLFTITDLSRASVDAWIGRIIAETDKQPRTMPTFWLHDATACKTMSMSPYLRHNIMNLIRRYPDRIGYNACILPKTFVVQVVSLFMKNLPTRSKNQLFFNRDEGLIWLQRVSKPYQVTASPGPVKGA